MAGTKRPREVEALQWPPSKMQCVSPPASPTSSSSSSASSSASSSRDRIYLPHFRKPALLPTPPDSLSGREENQKDKLLKQDSISLALSRLDPAKSLLLKQIQFVPATHLTYDDQMAILRGQKAYANVSTEHNRRRRAVLNLPTHSIFRRDGFKVSKTKQHDMNNVSKPKQRQSPVGFKNPHNWCYRRAVNQCLMNIPRIGAYLQNHEQSRPDVHRACRVEVVQSQTEEQSKPATEKACSVERADPCLLCSFAALFKARETRDSGATDIAIKQVDNALSNIGTPACFANHSQEDAHDYLLGVIDHFFTNYNYISPVVQGLFKIQSRQTWQCKSCNAVSAPGPDDETGLTLYFQPGETSVSLETLVSRAFSSRADIRCGICSKSATRTRIRKITAAPEALVIQLARFSYAPNGASVKLMNQVNIPDTLDLSQYLDLCALREPGNLKYQLSSVVHHSGTLKGGHYIATIDMPSSNNRERAIWEMNDSWVSRSTQNQHRGPPRSGFTPYILTYINCETRLRGSEGTVVRDVAANLRPLK